MQLEFNAGLLHFFFEGEDYNMKVVEHYWGEQRNITMASFVMSFCPRQSSTAYVYLSNYALIIERET